MMMVATVAIAVVMAMMMATVGVVALLARRRMNMAALVLGAAGGQG